MSPDWHRKVWRDGGHYLRRGDFREISGGELPVILHQYNRHDKRAGDKVELVETGNMSLLEMNCAVSAVYKVDPMENRVMRLDLAADVQGTDVDWFRDHTEFKGKQTNREWAIQSITQRVAQTLTSGVKPHQIRIYDKTGHRKTLLAQEVRKMAREEREFKLSFEQRWGYPETRIVTRVERQIGGAEVKKFGYSQVGHLYQLDKSDPFVQIVFPEDVDPPKRDLTFEDKMGIEWMRMWVAKDGIVNAKVRLRKECDYYFPSWGRQAQSERWRKWRKFVLEDESAQRTTRSDLLQSFRVSVNSQLKQAA